MVLSELASLGSSAQGVGQSPMSSGIQDRSATVFGNTAHVVGSPLKNIGAILKNLNTGSAVNGGFPTLPQSPIQNANPGRGSPTAASATVGVESDAREQTGFGFGGVVGIALVGLAGWLWMRNR